MFFNKMDEPPIWSVSVRSNLLRLHKWCDLIVHVINASDKDLQCICDRTCKNIECHTLKELVATYGNDMGSMLTWIKLGSVLLKKDVDIPTLTLKPTDEKNWGSYLKCNRSNLTKLKTTLESLSTAYKSKMDEIVEDDPFTDTEDETSSSSDSSDSSDDEHSKK